jgi:hypothetical protein
MTLTLPLRTNIPRPTKKDPNDTPDRVFKNIECSITFWTEGVLEYSVRYLHIGTNLRYTLGTCTGSWYKVLQVLGSTGLYRTNRRLRGDGECT